MPQPDKVMALDLPAEEAVLDEELSMVWEACRVKLGLLPNVLRSYTLRPEKLKCFLAFYNELMFGESGLSELEREMIAVVVSSVNHCYYCLVSHGATVRTLSDDPELGEMLVMNYRVAELSPRHRTMLDFVWKLAETPARMEEADRQSLRDAGFSDADIWDIAEVTGFYNFTNRLASATDMIPNPEYHGLSRG